MILWVFVRSKVRLFVVNEAGSCEEYELDIDVELDVQLAVGC